MAFLNKFFAANDGEQVSESPMSSDEDSDKSVIAEEDEEEGQLAVDVYQDKDNVYVKSTIAGVKPEDLDVTLASDMVSIRGERKHERQVKDEDYFFQECYWGSFSRALQLPVEIDVDKSEAELKDGILTLVLPKAGRSKTKKVRVRGEV